MYSPTKLRVVVADDNPQFLDELVSSLEPQFEIIAMAADGKSAMQAILHYRPDVAVLDLMMPIANGIEVTKRLMRADCRPAIVICTVEHDPEIIAAARDAGALGFVFKNRIATDLPCAINAAARGHVFVSPH